jgi:chromosome segregation ATPase
MDKIIINNTELTSLTTSITLLHEQLSSLKEENNKLWQERKELFLQEKRLRDMIVCYESGIKDITRENEGLTNKVKQLEKDIRFLKKLSKEL